MNSTARGWPRWSRPVTETVPTANLSPLAVVSLVERIQAALEAVEDEPRQGTILANPNASNVVIVAPEEDIAYWKGLVEQFDQTEGTYTFHYAPRRFGLSETAALVEEVVHRDGGPGDADRWRLVEDELTGTLIVTATYGQHLEIKDLIERLEETGPDSRISMRAFSLRYRDVEEMMNLLANLLEVGSLQELQPLEEGQEPPALTSAAIREPGESHGVTLSMDEGTNRILAVGPPRLLDQLGALIETLDVQHPQVLVEAMVVTLTDSQMHDLAVELQKIGADGGTSWRLATLFGGQAADPAPTLGTLPDLAGTGFEGVVLDPGNFTGVIRALETINQGRTLTIPKVLVNNNQTANLDSLDQQPFASVNASVSVATTSFAGTLDAGTTIQVTPQITDGDRLLLDYSVTLSRFTGEATEVLPPPRQQNILSSIATIPDGYAVIVGGLEVDVSTEAESRVPILGEIPLLGFFFRSRSVTLQKNHFFVFLRCSVMRHPRFEDLRYVSGRDLEIAGIGPDEPVLEPRLIR